MTGAYLQRRAGVSGRFIAKKFPSPCAYEKGMALSSSCDRQEGVRRKVRNTNNVGRSQDYETEIRTNAPPPIRSRTRACLLTLAALAGTRARSGRQRTRTSRKTADVQEEVVVTRHPPNRPVSQPTRLLPSTSSAPPNWRRSPPPTCLKSSRTSFPASTLQQNQISDASTFVRAPSLRGLAGDMTLVMINGKRLNRAALVQVAAG